MQPYFRLGIFSLWIMLLIIPQGLLAQELTGSEDLPLEPSSTEAVLDEEAQPEETREVVAVEDELVVETNSTDEPLVESIVEEANPAAMASAISWQLLSSVSLQNIAISINGYPLIKSVQNAQVSSSQMIGPWLVPGRNIMEITFIEKLGGKDKLDEKPSLNLRIVGISDSSSKQELTPLVYVLGGSVQYPSVRQLEFFMKEIPAPQLFDHGERVRLDPSTQAEAYRVIQAYTDCIRTQDVDTLLELVSFVLADGAAQTGKDLASYTSEVRELFAQHLLKEALDIKLPRANEIKWAEVLGGKAIHTSFPAGSGDFDLTFTLGRIDGKLVLVR